jgi:hypothetical protein
MRAAMLSILGWCSANYHLQEEQKPQLSEGDAGLDEVFAIPNMLQQMVAE